VQKHKIIIEAIVDSFLGKSFAYQYVAKTIDDDTALELWPC